MTDLWTSHDYTQSPEALLKQQSPTAAAPVYRNYPQQEIEYSGQPYFVDEFGGIKWIAPEDRPFADNSWGYGDAPKTLDEFYARLKGQIDALNSLPHISGWCYTQLTDVEQEQNGIYKYDRSAKFDMDKVHAIIARTPKGF